MRDVEGQLAGLEAEDQAEDCEAQHTPMPSLHQDLAYNILSAAGSNVEQETARRTQAIAAIVAYCNIEEGGMNPFLRKQRTRKAGLDHNSNALEDAILSVFTEKRPKRCWKCVGNAELPLLERMYEFSREGDVTKHFNRKHQ